MHPEDYITPRRRFPTADALTVRGVDLIMNSMHSETLITSRQNSHVKDAVRLRDSDERRSRKQFIIDGTREIARAIASGIRPTKAFVCEELCNTADRREAISAVQSAGAELLHVTGEVFAKLAFGDRHEGIVVVANAPQIGLNNLKLPAQPLIAVLEGLEKPGNIGAILRTADAAALDAVIVADGRSDLYNPNTIRASLGTVFRPNICEATSSETITWLREKKVSLIAARPDAPLLYKAADLRGAVAIVLGSEAAGLSDAWSIADTTAVKLPMHGLADSLNVSTTAAVLFYEALRQRSS